MKRDRPLLKIFPDILVILAVAPFALEVVLLALWPALNLPDFL